TRAAVLLERVSQLYFEVFFFQAEDGIRDYKVTGVQTCALPIYQRRHGDGRPSIGAPVAPRPEQPPRSEQHRQLPPDAGEPVPAEIGRASCRERVLIAVVAGSLKKEIVTDTDQSGD